MSTATWYQGLRLEKDPGDTFDLRWHYDQLLAGNEDVTSATATGDAGISVGTAAVTGKVVATRISGGTAGTTYRVTLTIDTSLGQRFTRSVDVRVESL